MRTTSILIFVVVTGTGGEICLTHAMKLLGEVHDFRPRAIASFVMRALRVSWLWVGVLLMTASFFSFLTMLSWFPVSFVIPATSLAYVAGAFGAKIFLGEQLNATRWAGILLICFGVAMAWVDDLPATLHWPSAATSIRWAILALDASNFWPMDDLAHGQARAQIPIIANGLVNASVASVNAASNSDGEECNDVARSSTENVDPRTAAIRTV